jgi:hypothetical protein
MASSSQWRLSLVIKRMAGAVIKASHGLLFGELLDDVITDY